MKTKYGMEWESEFSDAMIELYVWRNYEEQFNKRNKHPDVLERWMHMRNACQILFPERFIRRMPNGREREETGYVWSEWSDKLCRSFCNGDREFITVWGPSSSGKSTTFGILALCIWLAAPTETTVLVCSTTSKMLERRIWREIVKYYMMREGELPGELLRSKFSILTDPVKDTLSGVHGIAVQQGPVQDASSNINGQHNKYVYLIIDEMQATRPAALEAWDNLSTGVTECGFCGLGNPMSKLDPLGSVSMPEKGWEYLTTEKEEWKTKRGWCIYLDGLKSPGVKDPKRYPFLLTQKQIDNMKIDPGEDSPRFWTMRRGFLPPDGIVWAVLNDKMIEQYRVQEQVVWQSKPVIVAGIDPSYSMGGDKCIVYPAEVGMDTDGQRRILFLEPIRISLKAKEDELMIDTMCGEIAEELHKLGVATHHIGVDTTGNQWMLVDSLEKRLRSRGIHRVKFTGGASSDPISVQDPRPASDLYQNYVTEMWGRIGIYVQNDMIRGLDDNACKQFCTRMLDFSTKDNRKVVIESKVILHDRLGYSPDEADAAVIAIDVIRKVLNILPETSMGSGGVNADTLERLESIFLQSDEEGFTSEANQVFGDSMRNAMFSGIDSEDFPIQADPVEMEYDYAGGYEL